MILLMLILVGLVVLVSVDSTSAESDERTYGDAPPRSGRVR